MNARRRKVLNEAVRLIEQATNMVDAVCDAEQEALDNCPENLQGTERCETMEDAVDSLNDALEKLGEAEDCIQSAIG